MSFAEQMYLVLVIASFVCFGIALGAGAWYERAGARSRRKDDTVAH